MRYDGYYSDTTTKMRRRRRSEICRSFTCLPPWFILWRWFNGGESGGSRSRSMGRKWGKEKIEGNFDVKMKSGKVKGGSRNPEASSSNSREDVSEFGKEASFNLGVGFGLIYFVRDELNKMVEMRQKMELLLQEFRTELQNQENKPFYMPCESSNIPSSFSNTGVQETLYAEENDDSDQWPVVGFASDRYRREKSLRMDQLEAELEAEFDRLQITSDILNFSTHQYSEVNVEDSAPGLSFNMCYEEDDEPHDLGNDEFYGVCPRELERKLHQVLETRQQERINELESAVEYAMQQLEEKERELACWKDAARLISRHFPAIRSLLRKVKQDVHYTDPEFEVREMGKSLVNNSIYGARAI
ncbi:hypothetical protein DH2020_034289 [Rehmannia glutinosa]|uniref:Uncharacterized protein n=1 Tax=Rehmannia glutinosa TaxID=99300 RepID=A0ABR0VD16_REHGL